MSNTIKYSEGSESLALNKGNWWIGTGDSNKGPTVESGYWNAINPPDGGYTVYLNKETNGPSIHSITSDENLISFTNKISGNNYTTVAECLVYYQTQDDKLCVNREYENIVTDGLVFNVDAGYLPSYPISGTTWYDLSGNRYDGSLINSPAYSSGNMDFGGTNSYISFGSDLNFNFTNFSVSIWAKSPTNIKGNTGFPIHVTNLIGKGNWNSRSCWALGYRSSSSLPANTIIFFSGMDWYSGPSYSVDLFDLSLWNNFVGVATPSDQKLYLNGELVSTVITTKRTSITNVEDFQIGRSSYISRFFDGKISSAQIYNKELTDSEVLQNYNAQKGRFGL